MRWMYCFTPTIEFTQPDSTSVSRLRGGMLRVAFRLSPFATVAYLLLLVAQYIIALLFIYKLSSLVGGQGIDGFTVGDGVILLMLGGCSFLVVVGQLNAERYFNLRFCSIFGHLLSIHVRPSVALPVLERLASRDLTVVMDGVGASLNLFAIPSFLILATLGAVAVYGPAGLAVVVLLAVIIPVSYGLSRLADRNYNKIMDKVTERTEQCSLWLQHGPLLKQFADQSEQQRIGSILDEEMWLRNRDTLLRGADSYIVGFGRLVPFILLASIGATAYLLSWEGAVFWLAIPLLSAMLGMPRAYLSYKAVGRSLDELDTLFVDFRSEPPARSGVADSRYEILFDEDWPIWPSTLLGLIPGVLPEDTTQVHVLLTHFRLVPELGKTPHEVADKYIDLDASNLSTGQRLRLQLIRSVFLARLQGRCLLVNNDLSSLDSAAALAVRDTLSTFADIRFFTTASKALDSRRSDEYQGGAMDAPEFESPSTASSGYFGLVQLLKCSVWGVIALLVPAVMMSYAGNLTLPEYDPGAGWILAYVIAGIATGICAGLYIESSLRARMVQALREGLRDICAGGRTNHLQVVSRDVTTAFERIAWYAHDMAWVGALLTCSIGALWFGSGLSGLMLAGAFTGALVCLYRLSINELYRSRLATVAGFDALIRSTQGSHSLSSAGISGLERLGGWLAQTRQSVVLQGLAHFYEARMISVIARTICAASCTLLSDMAIVLIVMLGAFHQASGVGFVLAVTALLLVRSDLSNVFLAVTGFKSQSISVDRLLSFSSSKLKVPVWINGKALHISGFSGRRAYLPLTMQRGSLQLLRGASGTGKSDYLKGIAGVIEVQSVTQDCLIPDHSLQTWYFNPTAMELVFKTKDVVGALMEWVEALPADGSQLVLLDEVFLSLTVSAAVDAATRLQNYGQSSTNTLVLIDHRLDLGPTIDLLEIVR